MSTMQAWKPNDSLEEISKRWDRAGYRAAQSLDSSPPDPGHGKAQAIAVLS